MACFPILFRRAESYELTIGASDEAAQSENSGDNLHDDCEWIYAASVMRVLACINFCTYRVSLHS